MTIDNCNRQKNKQGTCVASRRTLKVRALNDGFRTTLLGGRVMLTAGIQELGATTIAQIVHELRSFDTFDDGNDPYGEHDFGMIQIGSQRVLWKIDYYDRALEFGSPDPADPAVTTRVLTIMLSSEY